MRENRKHNAPLRDRVRKQTANIPVAKSVDQAKGSAATRVRRVVSEKLCAALMVLLAAVLVLGLMPLVPAGQSTNSDAYADTTDANTLTTSSALVADTDADGNKTGTYHLNLSITGGLNTTNTKPTDIAIVIGTHRLGDQPGDDSSVTKLQAIQSAVTNFVQLIANQNSSLPESYQSAVDIIWFGQTAHSTTGGTALPDTGSASSDDASNASYVDGEEFKKFTNASFNSDTFASDYLNLTPTGAPQVNNNYAALYKTRLDFNARTDTANRDRLVIYLNSDAAVDTLFGFGGYGAYNNAGYAVNEAKQLKDAGTIIYALGDGSNVEAPYNLNDPSHTTADTYNGLMAAISSDYPNAYQDPNDTGAYLSGTDSTSMPTSGYYRAAYQRADLILDLTGNSESIWQKELAGTASPYSNVTVYAPLTNYLTYAGAAAKTASEYSATVTAKDSSNQTVSTLPTLSVTQPGTGDNTVAVSFGSDFTLADGVTYTVSIPVEPTQDAFKRWLGASSDPHLSAVSYNSTDNEAYYTATSNNTQSTGYIAGVSTFTPDKSTITLSKTWAMGADSRSNSPVDVTVKAYAAGADTSTADAVWTSNPISLAAGTDQTVSVPAGPTGYTYVVTESPVPSYAATYSSSGNGTSVSEDGTTFTLSGLTGQAETTAITNMYQQANLELTKTSSKDANTLLTGATYQLKTGSEGSSGSVVATGKTSNGKLTFDKALASNTTYYLVETSASAGYGIANPIKIEISGLTGSSSAVANLYSSTVSGTSYTYETTPSQTVAVTIPTDSSQTSFAITVTDTPTASLPTVGGTGTAPYVIAGLCAMLMAIGLVVRNRRKGRPQAGK